MLAVLLVIGAELVGEERVHVPDRFTEGPPADRRATLTRATGDDHGKARILGARPHHGLPQPRDSQDGDALGIHTFVGFEIVHGTAQAPSPGRD